MTTSRWIWSVWVLVLLGVVLPFGPLSGVQAWYGSFLLWTLMGVLVIVANVLITRRFVDADERESDHE
ncbi:hypothetical protein [Kushneria aurantia]|uniref:DUF3311 domain-containing protein n=1 Tax=Kushneria aurantia TaxID=504092 RepID=A0ABV6G595_9GAMM|nr:hypothetical protein [Kushneria aurantia]